jgi:6-phosphogluconolactonase
MRDYNAASTFFTHTKLLIPQTPNHHARAISNGEKPELPAGMVRPRSGDLWWFVEEIG